MTAGQARSARFDVVFPRKYIADATTRFAAIATVVVVVAVMLATSCSRDGGSSSPASLTLPNTARVMPPSKSCVPTAPVPATNERQTISVEGKERTFILSVPFGYTGKSSAPVVFDFYGRVGDAEERVADYEIDDEATASGMLVVTPQAAADRDTAKNAWATDIPLVTAILQSLEQRWCVNEHAVFAAGFSDGGVFAAYLACELPGVFAAIGTVAEVDYPPHCDATHPTFSVIGFHGKQDPLVPYTGGATDSGDGRSGLPGSPTPLPPSQPVARTFAAFAALDRCTGDATTDQYRANVEHSVYGGCPVGLAVELYSIDNGGHEWPGDPGADPAPIGSINANRLMVDFFLDHARP